MKKRIDITTDKALIFSAIMLVLFTVVMIVIFFIFQTVPDSLIVAFFGAFGLEGGYCAFIHKLKKEEKNMKVRLGDITGFDDAEVVELSEDIPDEGNLEINTDESEVEE